MEWKSTCYNEEREEIQHCYSNYSFCFVEEMFLNIRIQPNRTYVIEDLENNAMEWVTWIQKVVRGQKKKSVK